MYHFNPSNVYISFDSASDAVQPSLLSNFRMFSSPRRRHHLKQSCLILLPLQPLAQPFVCFLFVWICLFWTFLIKGII